MQKIKIILDIIDESEVEWECINLPQVQSSLRGLGFRYNGVHHQPVDDERYSIPFYQFLGKIDKISDNTNLKFQMAFKDEIEKRLEGLAGNIRITFQT